MNWLMRFMSGRYGGDQLGIATTVFYFALSIVFSACKLPFYWFLLPYACLFFSFFRMLSRNIVARRRENTVFMKYFTPVRTFFKKLIARFRAMRQRTKDKTHRYYRCPKCKNYLRVPRGAGKISISCPKCKEQFVRVVK